MRAFSCNAGILFLGLTFLRTALVYITISFEPCRPMQARVISFIFAGNSMPVSRRCGPPLFAATSAAKRMKMEYDSTVYPGDLE